MLYPVTTLNSRTRARLRPNSRRISVRDAERFWSKVRKDGPVPAHRPRLGRCWLYVGPCTSNGYGKFTYGGRDGIQTTAHRIAFTLTYGPPVQQVLHKCDNRACMRPSHLFDGTQADNMRDMMRKGRRYQPDNRGVRNGRAVLTAKQVREIRRRYAAGETNKSALGRDYSVTNVLIGLIVRREAWAHIT